MSKKYNLSKEQLIKLTRLCNQEQGTITGCRAEASIMANLYEKYGKAYGLGANGLYNYVRQSGWFANAAHHMDNGSYTTAQYSAVYDVLVNGNRFFPDYIDEHDCYDDFTAYNSGSEINKYDRSRYIKDKTIIKNRYGSVWTFYCFPDACSDPFGYTTKEESYKPCVEIPFEEIAHGSKGEDVKICQRLLKSRGYKGEDGKALKANGIFDKNSVYALKSFQRYHKLDDDGICGKKSWMALCGKI